MLGRLVDPTKLPLLEYFDQDKWAAARYSFLPAFDTEGPSTPMQQFWLTHPVEVTAGVPMDEDSLREMDEYLVQAQHEMGAPVEWAVSQEITHAQREVMEEHRDPPTKVMDEAITSMVLAVKNQKLSYTTLLLRRIPLHESPVLCWVTVVSQRAQ